MDDDDESLRGRLEWLRAPCSCCVSVPAADNLEGRRDEMRYIWRELLQLHVCGKEHQKEAARLREVVTAAEGAGDATEAQDELDILEAQIFDTNIYITTEQMSLRSLPTRRREVCKALDKFREEKPNPQPFGQRYHYPTHSGDTRDFDQTGFALRRAELRADLRSIAELANSELEHVHLERLDRARKRLKVSEWDAEEGKLLYELAWVNQCQREKEKKPHCAICGAEATQKPRAKDLIEGKWHCGPKCTECEKQRCATEFKAMNNSRHKSKRCVHCQFPTCAVCGAEHPASAKACGENHKGDWVCVPCRRKRK